MGKGLWRLLLCAHYLCYCLGGGAQILEDMLRYSTIYVSTSISSPITANDEYQIHSQGNIGTLHDVTKENKFDYNITFGIRKMARFDYDLKDDVFYDGSETIINSSSNVGALNGVEYQFKYSAIRDEMDTWTEHEYWIRYVGKWFIVKGAFEDQQMINLKYTNVSARVKASAGKWHMSLGASYRTHPAYGVDPIGEWLEQGHWWGKLAYDAGYTDQYYEIAPGVESWNWYDPDGQLIAKNDDEFYKYHFGQVVDNYNKHHIDSLGMQGEISTVIGLDFYTYTENTWLHAWASVYPIHYGLTDYSFDYKHTHAWHEGEKINLPTVDLDLGLIFGINLTDKFGFFMEGRYMRFWHIANYQFKTGINYIIF